MLSQQDFPFWHNNVAYTDLSGIPSDSYRTLEYNQLKTRIFAAHTKLVHLTQNPTYLLGLMNNPSQLP